MHSLIDNRRSSDMLRVAQDVGFALESFFGDNFRDITALTLDREDLPQEALEFDALEFLKNQGRSYPDTDEGRSLGNVTQRLVEEHLLHQPEHFEYWIKILEENGVKSSNLDELKKFKKKVTPITIKLLNMSDSEGRSFQIRGKDGAWKSIDESHAFDALSQYDAKALWARIFHRLTDELDYFGVGNETQFADCIYNGVMTGQFGKSVFFHSGLKQQLQAEGLTIGNAILITGDKPSTIDMIKQLRFSGVFDFDLGTLQHELTHRMQLETARFKNYNSMGPTLSCVAFGYLLGHLSVEALTSAISYISAGALSNSIVYSSALFILGASCTLGRRWIRPILQAPLFLFNMVKDPALAEAQPREMMYSSPAFTSVNHSVSVAALCDLGEDEDVPGSIYRLEKLYRDIHTLRLLGASETEITQALQRCYWNPLTQKYSKLDRKVEAAWQKWGVRSEDEKSALYHALECRLSLTKMFNQNRAIEIVSEEFSNLVDCVDYIRPLPDSRLTAYEA